MAWKILCYRIYNYTLHYSKARVRHLTTRSFFFYFYLIIKPFRKLLLSIFIFFYFIDASKNHWIPHWIHERFLESYDIFYGLKLSACRFHEVQIYESNLNFPLQIVSPKNSPTSDYSRLCSGRRNLAWKLRGESQAAEGTTDPRTTLGHSREVTNEFANKFACRACRAVARNL